MKTLPYILLSLIVAVGCGHVTHADNTPATAPAPSSAAQPAVEAVSQPCSPSDSQTAQSSIYGAPSEDQYVSQHYVESIHRPVVIAEQPVVVPAIYTQEPAYPAGPVYRYRPHRVYYYYRDSHGHRHKRSKWKSVGIVVGSAAAGAGIGALAGGPTGAAIGAASGGAGGFVYDRLTHNHR